MDVVVGVAVTGRVARLAMVGSGGQVFDQYALDLPDDTMTDLADTIVGTYREVADSGNRVAATRLCLPDASEAETLRQTVSNAGVQNVEVVAESDAAAALARSVGADAALLLADDDTVSLAVVGEDEESTSVLASVPIGASGAAVACAAVLQQAPGPEVTRIMLVGQRLDLDSIAAELRSTAPVEVPPDGSYALAHGAAEMAQDAANMEFPAGAATMMAPAAVDATMAAPAASDATQMAPATADSAAVGPQLAYSVEEPDVYEMPADSVEEFVPEQDDEAPYTTVIAPPPPRTVLMGSALAFVVVSFATLAVTVAINIRPAASVESQPAPTVQSDTVPGRYLPPVPHEPDPVALPIAEVSPAPAAPTVPSVRTNRGPVGNNNAPLAPAPAPQAPLPEPGPAPELPVVPVVPILPPPPFNPFPTVPTFTTTITTTPTTTTTTTTTTPTTTTTTPTTTTATSTTTTSTEPPPPVIEKTLPPVTQEPASQAPAYIPPAAPAYTPPAAPAYTPPAAVAPEPAPAPAPAAPAPVTEAPSSGGGSSSGSGGSVQAPVTTVPVSP